MDIVRIIYNKDKTIQLIRPNPKSKLPKETDDNWLKRVFDKATSKGAIYEDLDTKELPNNAENTICAWEGEKGKGIIVNNTKLDKIQSEKEKRKLIIEEKDRLLEEMAINSLKEQGLI